MVPFLAFTIPMAYMFAVLLSFSRFSSDGEFSAMLASGYSLKKALFPVLLMAVTLYFVGAMCASYFEAWGRRETVSFFHRKTQTELDNLIKFRIKPGVFMNDFLGYVIYAEKISENRTEFGNVMLAPGVEQADENFTLLAPKATITGSVESGNLRMSFSDGIVYSASAEKEESSVMMFKRGEIDILRIFEEKIFGPDQVSDDYRSYPPRELWHYIDSLSDATDPEDRALFYKARFLFHGRIATPFAVIAFALFALVLGVQDQRTGKSMGYLGAILTIISSYVVFMCFKWLSENGMISAPLGAWLPNTMLLGIGSFLVYQKNRLPPSESTMDPRLIPGLNRLLFFGRKNV